MDLQKKLDLRKDQVLDLKKTVGLRNQKAAVVLALDFSYSMEGLYKNGQVQDLVERILPLGLAFDDNGEVDFYLFQNDVKKVKENITLQNVDGFINSKVMGKYSMGGTNYAPVIKMILEDFKPKKGFLGLGSKTKLENPVYVIFITDGENGDRKETEKAISEASQYGIFFQFVGIGKEDFKFLQKLDDLQGRFMDNANFFKVENLNAKTDDDLYKLLLTEFPSYVYEARQKGLID